MGKTKVKLDKELYQKIEKIAEVAGYSSPEEFIIHVLEKEIRQFEGADSEEEIKKRLKGLGYIS
ncbi:MAG: M3 family metallopeptidase [Acidobacteria bacterium]|jgi:metal-responsive CopG/Arc/MetJ family transcriptional regulator|nr:M3 family metallopeptidase [Acidobacteriota bacterium]